MPGASRSKSKKSGSGSKYYTGNFGTNGGIDVSGDTKESAEKEEVPKKDLDSIVNTVGKMMNTKQGQATALAYIKKQNLTDEEYNTVMSRLGL